MHREPSLHITKSHLDLILKEYGIKAEMRVDLVKHLLRRGRQYQLSGRKRLAAEKYASNQKIAKQINRETASMKGDAERMLLIWNHLKKEESPFYKGLKPSGRNFTYIKEAVPLVERFAAAFRIGSMTTAYKEYIGIALEVIPNCSPQALVNRSEIIMESQSALIAIRDDENSEITIKMAEKYQDEVMLKSGIPSDISNNPLDYIHFVYAANFIKEKNIDPELYVKAQFEGLSWMNSIPEPKYMNGEKAIKRLQKYLYENPGARPKNLSTVALNTLDKFAYHVENHLTEY